ncbi:unnamed protein product [Effrenium voratum]|nr:unnamed protein product [Effrenium voratum]
MGMSPTSEGRATPPGSAGSGLVPSRDASPWDNAEVEASHAVTPLPMKSLELEGPGAEAYFIGTPPMTSEILPFLCEDKSLKDQTSELRPCAGRGSRVTEEARNMASRRKTQTTRTYAP